MPAVAAISRVAFLVVCIAIVGCASAGARDGYVAPRLTRNSMPQMSMPSAPSGSPSAMTLSFEVEVDEEGRADVSTLTLTGQGTSENRSAIEHWLGTVAFRPAEQNGVPVRGVFKMTIRGQSATVIRRR